MSTWAALKSIWLGCWHLEGNDARGHRHDVAMLASLGYISTIAPDGLSYTREWRITAEGFHALRLKDEGHG